MTTLGIDVRDKKIFIEVPVDDKAVKLLDIESKEGRAHFLRACKKTPMAYILTDDCILWEVKIDPSLTYEKLASDLKSRGWKEDV